MRQRETVHFRRAHLVLFFSPFEGQILFQMYIHAYNLRAQCEKYMQGARKYRVCIYNDKDGNKHSCEYLLTFERNKFLYIKKEGYFCIDLESLLSNKVYNNI